VVPGQITGSEVFGAADAGYYRRFNPVDTASTTFVQENHMRRPPVLGVLIVLIGLVLAACSSPAGEPGASAGGEPSAPAQSEGPGQSQSGGGGGDGEAPVPGDGAWTGGEADVDVSGDVSGSFTNPISPPSGTYSGATSLIYVSEEGTITIALNSGDPFAVGVTTTDFVAGSSSFEDCEVEYQQADESRIEGSFRCDDGSGVSTSGAVIGTITIEGSFTATR